MTLSERSEKNFFTSNCVHYINNNDFVLIIFERKNFHCELRKIDKTFEIFEHIFLLYFVALENLKDKLKYSFLHLSEISQFLTYIHRRSLEIFHIRIFSRL